MLFNRRRGLIGKKEAAKLVYSLYNYDFELGEQITTDIKPLEEGYSVTILLDVNTNANPTSSTGRLWKLICIYNGVLSVRGIYIGKAQASNQAQSVWWNNSTATSLSSSSTSIARHRIAVTHEANSDTLTVYYKKDSGTLRTQTIVNNFTPASNFLNFGSTGDNALPGGTINQAEVYNYILDSAAITEFFN